MKAGVDRRAGRHVWPVGDARGGGGEHASWTTWRNQTAWRGGAGSPRCGVWDMRNAAVDGQRAWMPILIGAKAHENGPVRY